MPTIRYRIPRSSRWVANHPEMSEDEFLAADRLIDTTLTNAALTIGRTLNGIADRRGWSWRYYSFNDYLTAKFGKRARATSSCATPTSSTPPWPK